MPSPLEALGPEDRREAEHRIRVHLLRARLVTVALIVSLALVAGGAVWAVTTGFLDRPLAQLPAAITWAVALYVLASLVAARFLSRRLLAKVNAASGADEALERHFGAVVVGMALREGAGILGAVWAALVGSLQWVVVLSVPPLLAMAVAWPRTGDVMRLLGSGPDGSGGRE